MSARFISPTDQTEKHLLILSGAFLGVFALALTLAPAARLRTWQVDYRWSHWLGFLAWAVLVWLAQRMLSRLLPDRDPYLFPVAAVLTGWGLLTIWRLSTGIGLRQSAWLVVVMLLFLLGLRYDRTRGSGALLAALRRYKYVWLTSGLLLTTATLFLGVNPLSAGPRLWLGCCGFYFQPSEPLKLLLIVYLAAYLADRQLSASTPLLTLLAPTLIMTGLALLLLVFQRDLGTASIFLFLYATVVYTGTGDRRVVILSLIALALAGVAGYALFDVVRLRVDAWINPWLDPSGRSYQIVQSLIAVANGGLFGRGPGMGNPGLVPIPQSDFIFAAISEESGLLGALALLGLLALLVNRGMRAALHAGDPFRRLLAAGLTVHLAAQSILIIGGNLRMLPLTGVTLPFVSYGGSSLLVSFIELLCLLLISAPQEGALTAPQAKSITQPRTTLVVSAGLMLGLAGAALAAGWWGFWRGPDLLTRTDNARRTIADRCVRRGSILDRQERPLAESTGQPGDMIRYYPYPALGPIVGYTHPVYGQSGLEASLDSYLRSLQGYPGLTQWWEHLLYGQPPPGLDIRLSLDLDLQTRADELLSGTPGGLVLLNADSGEIISMSSSPSFDANNLDAIWQGLVSDPSSPLFDRAAMGLYPPGSALGAFLLAGSRFDTAGAYGGKAATDCALAPASQTWGALLSAGCTEPVTSLAQSLGGPALLALLDTLGLYTPPALRLETLSSTRPTSAGDPARLALGLPDQGSETGLRVSPLQMALAVATLSNAGERPAPRLVMAVNTPQAGWVMLPVLSQPQQVFEAQAANDVTASLADEVLPIWQTVAVIPGEAGTGYTWYLGGTLPEWRGAPLALAVLIEESNPQRALELGREILQAALQP